jgi:hypothetical protein
MCVPAARSRGAIARIRARESFEASSSDGLVNFISKALKVAQIIAIATGTIGAESVSSSRA